MFQSRLFVFVFGRLGGRSLPSLILFCVMRLFSNQVLICFHCTGCFAPSPSSAVTVMGDGDGEIVLEGWDVADGLDGDDVCVEFVGPAADV